MSIVSELHSVIAPLVQPATLILAEQNGARPDKPYATLAVRRAVPGMATQGKLDENGFVQIILPFRATTEIQYYGLNAFELSQVMALKLKYPSTIDRAISAGVTILRVNPALRVPELLNQVQYEERGIVEFVSDHLMIGTDEVGLIESVRIECADHGCMIEINSGQ